MYMTPEEIREAFPDIVIGRGVRIERGVQIGSDVVIGKGAVIERAVVIGSDAVIGSDVRIESCAWIGSDVRIGSCAWIGSNAVIVVNQKGALVINGIGTTRHTSDPRFKPVKGEYKCA